MGEKKEFAAKNAAVTLSLDMTRLLDSTNRAIRNGMDETTSACVTKAKQLVRVDTANLQGSLQMRPAKSMGTRTHAEWGSYNVNYAIYQEIGPVSGARTWAFRPYLRPSRDAEYPSLVRRIKKHLK